MSNQLVTATACRVFLEGNELRGIEATNRRFQPYSVWLRWRIVAFAETSESAEYRLAVNEANSYK